MYVMLINMKRSTPKCILMTASGIFLVCMYTSLIWHLMAATYSWDVSSVRIGANGHVDQVINVDVEDEDDGDDDDIWMMCLISGGCWCYVGVV